MNWLRRILGGNGHRYFACVLGIAGHLMLGGLAWRGSLFAVVALVIVASCWTVLATLTGISWMRTITSWEKTLGAWGETQKLAANYGELLMEACDALATWDRERSEEIIERTRTISFLRQKNFDERMGND